MAVKLLGEVANLLQMRIISLWLDMDQDIQMLQLAAKYGVHDCKPVLTPMDPHIDLR